MLYLKCLSLNDGEDIYRMLQEIDNDDNGFHNKVKGMTYAQYCGWLSKEYDYDNGINMPGWMVPQSSYWLYCDEVPVGYGRIRHHLNKNLEDNSGHIGYAIALSKRGLGYGNKILRLLMIECKRLGIKEVQIGANKENIRSNKVILCNKGVFIRDNQEKNFYKIDTSK